jgi:predicted dehydrogenase/threonine dehydrogenase-like Zn-dependent dehydrogenase
MKQVLIRKGEAVVEEVPAPQAEAGCVLVAVSHSCISVGTEMSGVSSSGTPLWKRALKDPWKVRKALEMAATRGVAHTTSVVKGELEAGSATGYSAAGTVIAVGAGVERFVPGDRVACAGAQCAHHAEYICVPENLAAPVPDELGFGPASTVTLGAIAMQGMRRAQPTLGETFVVVGLGILGQLTVQLLKANGCRVIGLDVLADRTAQAITMGMDVGLLPEDGATEEKVFQLTDGIGADGVLVTAASANDKLLTEAFRLTRRKGRVVLVGDVPINIDRADIYRKEIDFFISTSYGPGRYDQRYEEQGLDYPVGYVRWTENRNMSEYLRLLAEGRIQTDPLVEAVYPVERANAAYTALKTADKKPLMVLLEYPQDNPEKAPRSRIDNPQPTARDRAGKAVRIALIGAGGFAKGMHLPNIQNLRGDFRLQAVVSRSGHNAQTVARQYEAAYATTDVEEVFSDDAVDAVLIATRHHLHADLVLKALRAGKHVLVEKPLAMNGEELDRIAAFFEGKATAPVLLTGFNRRFSPHMQRILDIAARRNNPFIANYRMNAGHIPSDHWVHGPEGGGRNIGEACHIYDLFTALAGSAVAKVEAQAIAPTTTHFRRDDNFVATLGFEDGSVATLSYTALGHKDHAKERMELYVDGVVAELDDYRQTRFAGLPGRGTQSTTQDKGQKEELVAFAAAIRGEADWPIPLWQQLQAMRVAFEVQARIDRREAGG